MSLCHETYRRCASVALVLAIVLIALPALLNAQTAPAPKTSSMQSDDACPRWNCSLVISGEPGRQHSRSQRPRPMAVKLPSIDAGLRHQSLLQLHQVSGSRRQLRRRLESQRSAFNAIRRRAEGDLARRGRELFRAHAARIRALSSERHQPSNGVAAILGGGMDLKIWKRVSLRVFEADYQLAAQNFSDEVPPDDRGLRRQTYNGVRLTTGLVFNFGGAPELPVAASCSVRPRRSHGRRTGARDRRRQQLQPQAHAHLCLGQQRRQDRRQGYRRQHRHQRRQPAAATPSPPRSPMPRPRRTTRPVAPPTSP